MNTFKFLPSYAFLGVFAYFFHRNHMNTDNRHPGLAIFGIMFLVGICNRFLSLLVGNDIVCSCIPIILWGFAGAIHANSYIDQQKFDSDVWNHRERIATITGVILFVIMFLIGFIFG